MDRSGSPRADMTHGFMHSVIYEAAHEATHDVADLSLNVAMSLYMHCVSLQPTAAVLQSCNLLPETAS